MNKFIYWMSITLLWLPYTIFFPTRIIGKKNLIYKKSIWACNHQTNNDVIVLGTKIYSQMYVLGKAELFKNKLAKRWLKDVGAISVQRGKADIEAVKQCLRVLKEKDKPLLIFPTGTRTSSPEEVENLKNGVAMFALKSGAPIVPMVLVRKPRLFRTNRLVIGEPIYLDKYQGQKADKELYNKISEEVTLEMEDLLKKYSYKSKKVKNTQEAK